MKGLNFGNNSLWFSLFLALGSDDEDDNYFGFYKPKCFTSIYDKVPISQVQIPFSLYTIITRILDIASERFFVINLNEPDFAFCRVFIFKLKGIVPHADDNRIEPCRVQPQRGSRDHQYQ